MFCIDPVCFNVSFFIFTYIPILLITLSDIMPDYSENYCKSNCIEKKCHIDYFMTDDCLCFDETNNYESFCYRYFIKNNNYFYLEEFMVFVWPLIWIVFEVITIIFTNLNFKGIECFYDKMDDYFFKLKINNDKEKYLNVLRGYIKLFTIKLCCILTFMFFSHLIYRSVSPNALVQTIPDNCFHDSIKNINVCYDETYKSFNTYETVEFKQNKDYQKILKYYLIVMLFFTLQFLRFLISLVVAASAYLRTTLCASEYSSVKNEDTYNAIEMNNIIETD